MSELSGACLHQHPEKAMLLMTWTEDSSEQDRVSRVLIATGEKKGDSSQHHLLLWTAVLLIPISINISKHLHVGARLVKQ